MHKNVQTLLERYEKTGFRYPCLIAEKFNLDSSDSYDLNEIIFSIEKIIPLEDIVIALIEDGKFGPDVISGHRNSYMKLYSPMSFVYPIALRRLSDLFEHELDDIPLNDLDIIVTTACSCDVCSSDHYINVYDMCDIVLLSVRMYMLGVEAAHRMKQNRKEDETDIRSEVERRILAVLSDSFSVDVALNIPAPYVEEMVESAIKTMSGIPVNEWADASLRAIIGAVVLKYMSE